MSGGCLEFLWLLDHDILKDGSLIDVQWATYPRVYLFLPYKGWCRIRLRCMGFVAVLFSVAFKTMGFHSYNYYVWSH